MDGKVMRETKRIDAADYAQVVFHESSNNIIFLIK